ncbi:tripartite motif-containing protein 16-like isoform X2 [Myxocyprinus asiaticus]|uniref:tripartite motif-containing protein 16-like isoform X2 n=1 Tax=Myxocyprinus asiaticus TaxID=70543 RepID=UPI002221D447|nr:tripartite motif-containing protein 16-like isoform X2 [Myxocyprinus asiaticus]
MVAPFYLCTCSEMAEDNMVVMGSLAQEQFSCSICLDLLKHPVTIPCGHTYCMSCIADYWNQDDQKGVYSCPQCRQTSTTRPALNKNVMFAEMVEKLKMTRIQTNRPATSYSVSGDVKCDICTGRKYKAVMSCLTCLESYCQIHFEHHEKFHSGRRHQVTDATQRLHQMICSKHHKRLEIYCRTDQQCVCYLCMMEEHKNHDTVAAAVERKKKQILGEIQRTFQQKTQEREKQLQDLREAVKFYKHSAQAAVADSERIFTELIRSIERSRSEVTQLIRDQERVAVCQAEGLLERLEKEIDDLRRRDAELQQISQTEDHIHVLQSFHSFSALPETKDLPSITVSSLLYFDDVRKYVSQLKEKLVDICRDESEKISDRVMHIDIISNELKTRDEFLQYFHQFTLDSNTAYKYLSLSEGNRQVNYTGRELQYPDHPDRFDGWPQVLCRESVCGRCYWEVEWSDYVGILVSYKSICRKGCRNECRFGSNDQSWRLLCSPSSCSFGHNNKETDLPLVSSSSRIGVYVDHSAGILSFYSVSDTMTLIHREQTTFTQPLYPGFWVYGSVKLCHQ